MRSMVLPVADQKVAHGAYVELSSNSYVAGSNVAVNQLIEHALPKHLTIEVERILSSVKSLLHWCNVDRTLAATASVPATRRIAS